MTIEQLNDLMLLLTRGCTDSDIEDWCSERGVSEKEAFHAAAVHRAPAGCKACRHVGVYPDMHPCVNCSRGKEDLFEKIL